MKELMSTVRSSVYNPVFYRELLQKRFLFSFKYYSAFAFFIVLVLTITLSIPLVSDANKVAREFPKKFFEYIPDQLEVTVTNGVVSTNVEEPFHFPVPPPFREALEKDGIMNLLVIDTKAPFSVAQFSDFRTLAWLGSNQWVYVGDYQGAIQIQPLDKGVSLVVNEEILRTYESYIAPYYKYIGPIIAVAIFVALCFIYVGYLLYMIIGAIVIYILLKLMKIPATYGKSYQIGLHALTLPVLLQFLFVLLNLPIMRIPLLPTVILVTVVYVNFKGFTPAPIVEEVVPA